MRLAAVVIAHNEERRIIKCLQSVSFCNEITVVDSGSRDRTIDIARSFGAKVHERPLFSFADQKNYAIAQASAEWILSIDADERVTPSLAREISLVAGSGAVGNRHGDGANSRRDFLL